MNNTDWAHIGFPLWESLDYATVNYELPKSRVALQGATTAKPELRVTMPQRLPAEHRVGTQGRGPPGAPPVKSVLTRGKKTLLRPVSFWVGGGGGAGSRERETVYVCTRAQSLSRVWLCATPWTVAHQAPLSMGFSRQEYWSGLPCPPPGGSFPPRDRTCISYVSSTGRRILYQ